MVKTRTAKEWPVKSMLLFLLIILTAGFGGYLLMSRETLTSYVLAHLGALGALGLFGWVAGFIAMKKGRHFYSVFLLTSMLSILSGVFVVLIVGDSVTCGGSISLATAVIILAVIAFLKKKKQFITEAD
ncbi:MAG: hypothetical protein GWO41_05510 [candidate division Zixibacteria bacterium]|nr:hypothetical protein [candidate division Zixibacteria bacterium]NIT52203.1 hypothetical protein [candidate division Zixibacteria bacterium]NIW40196.1 hypothetical protein [candidate division Zixibacteria bacterium]NIX57310.1 hypothetical protein [candidate division Zixibacteria bacterium]